MNDDFNTPEAVAVLFELAKAINLNKDRAPDEAKKHARILIKLGGVLGLLQQSPQDFLTAGMGEQAQDTNLIEQLIVERNQAREDKNWSRADEIRGQFKQMGIVLEDCDGKTSWRRS